MEVIELSKKLLDDVREGKNHSEMIRKIADLDRNDLEESLDDERKRKAFWINFYNAEAQMIIEKHPVLHRLKLVYSIPFSHVAGKRLSLNRMENGILRKSKTFLGREKNFISGFEKRMRIDEVDPRIHFALNCGSESCPAIRYYEPENIDEQLDEATENYLSQEVERDGSVLYVPKVFDWYESDFGGTHGIREFLKEYGYDDFERIKYKKFRWKRQTRNFLN